MKFSVGVEYAIHCLLYMVNMEDGKSIGIRDLSTFQGISETYLSKIYAKLSKSGIVKSVPGVKGGYTLARSADKITFCDIVEAVEGSEPFFHCADIMQNSVLAKQNLPPRNPAKCPCVIKAVMFEAENQMKKYLSTKTLAWLYDQMYHDMLPKEYETSMLEWFNKENK